MIGTIMWVLGVLAVAVIVVLVLRQWLLNRTSERHHAERFEGVVYRVGQAAIAERASRDPRATVICMHGFVEDMRYFAHLYQDPDVQLILLQSCDYHVPIEQPRYEQPAWAQAPQVAEGTIAYDAAVLVQALENLPKSDTIRVHGHSRGGAVVLEAAAMRPDLFRNVEVILEAPVLPQGRTYKPTSSAYQWSMPFLVPLWRKQPISSSNRATWGPLDDPRKRELIEGLPFNPKTVRTMITNMRDIGDWMQRRDTSIYQNVTCGAVVVPEKDKVLDAQAMLKSAQQAKGRLDVVQVPGCSHFPAFDRPDAIPQLGSLCAPAQSA